MFGSSISSLICSCSACEENIEIDTNVINLEKYNEKKGLYYQNEGAFECGECGYSADFIIKDPYLVYSKQKVERKCNNCDSTYIFRYEELGHGDLERNERSGNKCDKCGDDRVSMRIY